MRSRHEPKKTINSLLQQYVTEKLKQNGARSAACIALKEYTGIHKDTAARNIEFFESGYIFATTSLNPKERHTRANYAAILLSYLGAPQVSELIKSMHDQYRTWDVEWQYPPATNGDNKHET